MLHVWVIQYHSFKEVSIRIQCFVFLYSQMIVKKKMWRICQNGSIFVLSLIFSNLSGKTSLTLLFASFIIFLREKESCMFPCTWTFSIWHGIQVISSFELKEKSDIGICGKGHCLYRPCTHRIFSRIHVFCANIPKPFLNW